MEKKFIGFNKKDDLMLLDDKYIKLIEDFKAKRVGLKKYCNVLDNDMSLESESNVVFPDLSGVSSAISVFENQEDVQLSDIEQQFALVSTKGKYHGAIIRVPMKLFELYSEKYLISLLQRIARSQVNERNKSISTLISSIEATDGTGLTDIDKALNITLNVDHAADATVITNRSGYAYLIENGVLKEGDTTYRGKELIVLDDQVLSSVDGKYSFYIGTLANKYAYIDQEVTKVEAYENIRKASLIIRFGEMYDVVDTGENAIVRIDITK